MFLPACALIHCIADVPAFVVLDRGADFMDALRVGLRVHHVVHADDGIEPAGEETVERHVCFPAKASRENSQMMIPGARRLKRSSVDVIIFADNHAVCAVTVEQLLKV